MSVEQVERVPSVKMVKSLRNMGYNNYDAVFDIVDNSIDAMASAVTISVEKGPFNTVKSITIYDNGIGMNEEELVEAVRLGSETRHRENDLGKFGMGLSTGGMSLTKTMSVTSQKKDGQLYTIRHDIDLMEAEQKFLYPISHSKPYHITKFRDVLGNEESGTMVMLENCDNIKHRYDTFVRNMKDLFSQRFRYLLSEKFKIVINGEIVKVMDYLQISDQGTKTFYDEMVPVVFENAKGETIKDKIRVVVVKLNGSGYNLKMTTQGFSLLRNGRELKDNDTLGLWTRHPSYNAIRGEVHFSDKLDECMGVTVDKAKIDLNDEILQQIKVAVASVIKKIKKEVLIEAEQRKLEKEREENPNGNEGVESATKHINESVKKRKKITAFPKENVVEWEYAQRGRKAPIYETYRSGKTLVVEYNTDHRFYDLFIRGVGRTKEQRTEAAILVYGLAKAQQMLSVEEYDAELLENFMQLVATNWDSMLEKE